MNQTPEELAEQLAKRLAIEHLPHPFELSALPLILSAIQSATQPLQTRIDELLLQQAQNEIAWAGITAENAELRKLARELSHIENWLCSVSDYEGDDSLPDVIKREFDELVSENVALLRALRDVSMEAHSTCGRLCAKDYLPRGRHAPDCPVDYYEIADAALAANSTQLPTNP
jgi:hypothetical protein